VPKRGREQVSYILKVLMGSHRIIRIQPKKTLKKLRRGIQVTTNCPCMDGWRSQLKKYVPGIAGAVKTGKNIDISQLVGHFRQHPAFLNADKFFSSVYNVLLTKQ
jgi:hypothetical protein